MHQKTNLPIIVSGGKPKGYLSSQADLMATVLKNNYHLTSSLKEDKSRNTADESHFLSSLLKHNHLNTIYLVTNAWHMPRSVFIFQCAGIKVLPAPMGYYLYGPRYSVLSFFPNKDALYASVVALHEYIGLFWYHLYYGKQCHSESTPSA